ncbi:MAG: alpha/beta fold hydrolase [bacterium]|nr:alpha/beta fold hydrolase [bacterium]
MDFPKSRIKELMKGLMKEIIDGGYTMSEYSINLKSGKDAVLFIHGLGGSPFELKYVAGQLHKAGFTVLAPCLDGHGKTVDELKKATWTEWCSTVEKSYNELKQESDSVFIAGSCMGALLALYMSTKLEVSGLSLMSTTLFYDGWNLPWYRVLLPLAYLPPFRHFMSFEEKYPYGIKNDELRTQFQTFMDNKNKQSSAASFDLPMVSMYEVSKLIKATKKAIPGIETPTLILHALEDDTASIKNANYIEKKIKSQKVRKVFLDDSYHIIPIDQQKNIVAQETIRFFKENAVS